MDKVQKHNLFNVHVCLLQIHVCIDCCKDSHTTTCKESLFFFFFFKYSSHKNDQMFKQTPFVNK
jgi:hypothetical protein